MSDGLSFSQPPGLVPGSNSLLETQMIGTMIAAIIYGFLVILFIDCSRLLFKKSTAVPSKKLNAFLIFFASLLLLLSTLSLVQGVLVSATSIFGRKSFPSLSGGAPFVLPVSIWTADGFMAYLVGRLILHKKYLKSVLGSGHGSPYTRIMAMTIESATLLILLGIPYFFLVAYQNTNGSMFVLQLLPQICAISPLLIIYRVAQGRAAMQMPLDGGLKQSDVEANLGSLHFKTRSISLSSIESFRIDDVDEKPSEQEI
ncbi:hypothetical protein CVT25_003663 [Psilocybe cyanescens]|uniref:Uncharacterized protein n=1 Tax=Psilocybe cyanescens TaxID=93625 RepID=A0A409XQZ3_PSICY|nr:hypothetical protein CVT25_003663 [Psilocybe cyanescens]